MRYLWLAFFPLVAWGTTSVIPPNTVVGNSTNVTAVPYATTYPPALYIGVADPIAYGAYADTVLLQAIGAFNSTAGGNSVSFGKTIGGNFAGATITMTGCGALVATAPVVVTSGMNYSNGDTVTMTNGLTVTVTWAVAGVVQPVSGSNNTPGVAILGTGAVSSWPGGGAFSQVSTSGAGSGLTITATQTALPLSTTIQGTFTGGSTIPLNASCSQTLTNSTQWVTWGHDDAPAFAAAIASGAGTVRLSTNHTYGIRSPVVLNSTTPQIFDLNGATVVALDPIASMFTSNTNGTVFHVPFRGKVRSGLLEGMGIATVCVLQGSNLYDWEDVTANDCTTANLEINKVGAGGSVVLNNQYRFQIYNNPLMVPNYPTYCIWNAYTNATDNQFMPGEFWVGCQQAGVYDQSFSTFYQGPIHVYGVSNGPPFNFAGAAVMADNLYADSPEGYYCGFQLTGNDGRITAWTVIVASNNLMAQGGVCIPGTGQNNTIANGVFNTSLPAVLGCQPLQTSSSGRYNNYFINNINCLQSPGTPIFFTFNSGPALTAAGATNYCQPNGTNCNTSSILPYTTIPRGCLLQNFYFGTTNNSDIGSGQTYIATVLGASGTALTCTLTGTGSGTTQCSDLTDVEQMGAGQSLEVKVVTSGGASAQRVYGAFECLALH
jgi:hypothetical protein